MTQIPSGTKFVGISSTVPTPENRSAQNNSTTEIYTLADLQESVLDLTTPPNDGDVLTYDTGTNAPVWAAPAASPTTTVVNISSAQILNMGSSPIELLPAPGVGKYYDYDIFLESSISALNLSGTNVVIGDQSDFGGTVVSGYALQSSNGKFFRVNQSNPIYTITDGLATAAPIQMARVNFPIVMTTYGGTNPASCTGTLRAIITYTVRTFGA